MGNQIMYSKGPGFALLPEGTYDFAIKSAKQTVSKEKQNPQLEINLEVMDGPQVGKTMRTWRSLLASASGFLDEYLDAVGVERVDTGDKDEDGNPILVFDLDELIGRMFRADIEHRTDNSNRKQADLRNLGPSPLAAKMGVKTGKAKDAEGGSSSELAAVAPATPSTSGAPVPARRPRPAPQS